MTNPLDTVLRVLMVEDRATDVLIARDELEQTSGVMFQVQHVARLGEALALLQQQPFDAVLLDLNLPDSLGLDTFTQLRCAVPAIAIVLMSHSDDATLALHAVQAGAQDYVVKGTQNGQLARSLRYAVERARSEQALLASQLQLQILGRRVLKAQETERRRVAHELHDELGQSLTAIKINLQSQQRMSALPPTGLDLENIRIVEDALQQVRRLSLALRPSMLDDLGLPAALAWLADSASLNRELVVQLQCDMVSERIPPDIETACFRIVQESLTNIRRHAQAHLVSIALECDDHHLLLSVTDDGVGFDKVNAGAALQSKFSLGLLGMQERALAIGGQITIDTAPGAGCTVRLQCTLDAFVASTL
jgi:signal transduction histidine kinase